MVIYERMPEPYSGKDVGIILGIIRESVPLTGTCNGTNKDFIFPENCAPFYDVNMDGVINKDDIKVYDDGVEVPVDSFNPTTRTATLQTAPSNGSVITGDCTEQMEVLLGQDVEIGPDYEKKEYEVLRSALKRTRFPSFTLNTKASLLVGDFEYVKLAFNQAGIMLTEPVDVRALVICDARSADEKDRILFVPRGKLTVSPFISAKAGTDFATNSIEIAADERARFVEVENFQGASADSTDENPVHTFTGAGTYTVSLKATNDAGEVVFTEFNYITVTE